jgi:predicted HAD superfamily Cof-like phosphohydrolase
MTTFHVHLFREMRLKFENIEADTPEAAALIAAEKQTDDADVCEDCEGENLAALVDVVGDEDFSQSVTIDFGTERQRKAAASLLAALKFTLEFLEANDDGENDVTSRIASAHAAIAEAESAGISPSSTNMTPLLRQTLEDVAEWLETGKIDGVGFDEASILDDIRQSLASANPPSPPEIDIHAQLAARQQIAEVWSILDVQSVQADLTDEQAWAVLERVRRFYDASVGINWDVLTYHAAEIAGKAAETDAGEEA